MLVLEGAGDAAVGWGDTTLGRLRDRAWMLSGSARPGAHGSQARSAPLQFPPVSWHERRLKRLGQQEPQAVLRVGPASCRPQIPEPGVPTI